MNKQRVQTDPKHYSQLTEQMSPPSNMVSGLLNAFWVGGAICLLGQALADIGVDARVVGVEVDGLAGGGQPVLEEDRVQAEHGVAGEAQVQVDPQAAVGRAAEVLVAVDPP